MSFNTALTSGQLDSLRGTASASPSHRARPCLSLCPNTNILTARVNQATFGASFAQLTFDGGSGTLANVRVGMTVLISHTSDRAKAFFRGRVRKDPTSTQIYINETSAAVADNDYIFVVDDFRIWDKLAREVGGVQYPDYDVAFRQLLPRISGLKSGYAATAVSSIITLSFAPSVAAATDGATISSYLWAVGDGTITVGSTTTQNITATFPPGFRWVHFSATDSGGRVSTRHIPVWSHDATYPVTLLDHGDLTVSASIDEGFSGQVSAFDGIGTVLDNTLVCAWLDGETYNGTQTNIAGNMVLVGRLRTEDSRTDYADGQQDATTQFDIEGPLQQLARLEITSQQIDNAASPTKFNEVDTLTLWREIHLLLTEYSTFEELHSLAFDDVTDNFRETGIVTQAGDLLSAVNALAGGLNAAIQMNAAGEAEIVRDASLIPTGSRGALATVAAWDKQDVTSFDITHDHVTIVGKLDASGGSYDTTSGGKLNVALSLAPGVAQDYPSGTGQLANQILQVNQTLAAAEAELSIRAGHALAAAQGADQLTITHPDGYWFLTPSLNQWYTFALAGGETARGIVLDTSTRWQLISISVTHEVDTGARTVEATYRRETSGSPGQAYRLPAQSSAPLTLPSFPALAGFPMLDIGPFFLSPELTATLSPPNLAGSMSTMLLHDGNMALIWTSTQAFVCADLLKKLTPTWKDITPPLSGSETIIQAKFVGTSSPAVMVMTAGTPAVSDVWTQVFDLTVADGGWSAHVYCVSPGVVGATYQAGTGWKTTVGPEGCPPGTYYSRRCWIERTFTAAPVTSIAIEYSFTRGANVGYPTTDIMFNVLGVADNRVNPEIGVFQWEGVQSMSSLAVEARSGITSVVGDDPGGECVITRITLTGTGTNPFSPPVSGGVLYYRANPFNMASAWAGNSLPDVTPELFQIGSSANDIFVYGPVASEVFYSDDRGETWGSAISAGTTPGSVGGFDTQRIGAVTLVAADDRVRIATTQGGAYSDYTNLPTDNVPTAIFIPRYKFAGSNNGSGVSAPDYLLGSAVPASGTGHALWKVTASGATLTDITPLDGSDEGLAVGPHCLAIPWYSTAYQDILAILDFAGTRKLAISTDSGATWTLSGALHATAAYITTRRSDTGRRQLFIANGPNLIYCSDYRSSPPVMAIRLGPTASNIIGIDILP